MSYKKELVIGEIPDDFNPSRHTPIGPFCFAENEYKYPSWTNLSFVDPFLDKNYLQLSDQRTSKEAIYYTELIGKKINKRLNVQHSLDYWHKLIYPWVCMALQVLWNHQQILLEFLENNSTEKFFVRINVEKEWFIKDTADFQNLTSKSINFIEWLYSIMLESISPDNVTIHYSKEYEFDKTESVNLGLPWWRNISLYARQFFSRVFLRFQKAYGMNLLDVVLFNCILFFKKSSSSIKYSEFTSPQSQTLNWVIDIPEYLFGVLPDSILKLVSSEKKTPKKDLKILHVFNKLFYDDYIKHKAALVAEKGGVVISSQHGGHNYGSAFSTEFIKKIEFECSAFFSWGWKTDDPMENIIPLPSPFMTKFFNKHRNRTNNVIMVGNIANLLPYRFDNVRPSNWIKYRACKKEFIENLSLSNKKKFLYKTYHNEKCALSEKEFLIKYFPWIHFLKSSLHKHILKCAVVVLDHPGTTLNLAIAANIPILMIWPKGVFHFNRSTEEYFEAFKSLGLYFNDPARAASQLDDMDSFIAHWNSEEVQEFRKKWMKKYARVDKGWRLKWLKTIREL